ncbi:LysR family transcriptional regulator [Secundilactobacillus folii]|uniref:LysR family transcriptional regulator n=1 Tax=Secundilactobacillus folii TaxID=2678357 RepID=A0A7X2XU43_9LACO|nr:LysR family transcriptional regulator [Secundilactobacillus folii]MTV81575.1 LysR family transcriptional regulator [Secundilactobacillus folii]
MEIRQLKTLQMIDELHSFSKAAKRLGYTQSTVSMQIQKLESEVGGKLLQYDGHDVTLTAAGQAMMPMVNRTLQDYGSLERFSQTTDQFGQLRIAAPESLTISLVTPMLKRFHKVQPKVDIHLQNATCLHNEEALIRGDVDVAFMMWPSRPKPQLVDRDLGEQEIVLVVSKTATFKQLLADPSATFIINEPDCSYRNQFETSLWQQHQRRFPTWMLPSIAAIKAAVINGLGFSYLPKSMVIAELESGELTAIPTDIENHIHAHLLTRSDSKENRSIAKFTSLFNAVQQEPN